VQLAHGNGQIKPVEHSQRRDLTAPGDESRDAHAGALQGNATDYADYAAATDYGNDIPAESFDYTDYAAATDYVIDTSSDSFTPEHPLPEAADGQERMTSIRLAR